MQLGELRTTNSRVSLPNRVKRCADGLLCLPRWDPIRIILNNIRWGLMDNKFKGEPPELFQSGPHLHLWKIAQHGSCYC